MPQRHRTWSIPAALTASALLWLGIALQRGISGRELWIFAALDVVVHGGLCMLWFNLGVIRPLIAMQRRLAVESLDDLGREPPGRLSVWAPRELQNLHQAIASTLERLVDEHRKQRAASDQLMDTNTSLGEQRRKLVRAERNSRANEARVRAIFDAIEDALVTTESDGCITEWNPAFEDIFGLTREDVLDRKLADLVLSDGSRETYADVVAGRLAGRSSASGSSGKKRRTFEIEARRKSGETFPAEVRVVAVETPRTTLLTTSIRDLSEARRIEAELRAAQKLESVGRLAAGVAHEINTPVQFVGDSVHFLRESMDALLKLCGDYKEAVAVLELDPLARVELEQRLERAEEDADLAYVQEQVPKAFDRTSDGVQRVANIVRAMKEFAHPDQRNKVAADLNRALENTIVVATNELKYVADVTTDFAQIPSVVCHPGELNQVFLNLLVNASHAIQDKVRGTDQRGTVTVRTRLEDNHVCVSIADTGSGIPADVQGKIFDPFFTTKEVGRGTGQGLAIARNVVVDKHGGSISFETQPGVGTTFFVRVPLDAAA